MASSSVRVVLLLLVTAALVVSCSCTSNPQRDDAPPRRHHLRHLSATNSTPERVLPITIKASISPAPLSTPSATKATQCLVSTFPTATSPSSTLARPGMGNRVSLSTTTTTTSATYQVLGGKTSLVPSPTPSPTIMTAPTTEGNNNKNNNNHHNYDGTDDTDVDVDVVVVEQAIVDWFNGLLAKLGFHIKSSPSTTTMAPTSAPTVATASLIPPTSNATDSHSVSILNSNATHKDRPPPRNTSSGGLAGSCYMCPPQDDDDMFSDGNDSIYNNNYDDNRDDRSMVVVSTTTYGLWTVEGFLHVPPRTTSNGPTTTPSDNLWSSLVSESPHLVSDWSRLFCNCIRGEDDRQGDTTVVCQIHVVEGHFSNN